MPSTAGGGRRPLTRSVCAAARAAGEAGGALHKHRCTLDHTPPVSDPAFAHSQSPISRLSNEELLLIFEDALYSTFSDVATFTPPWKPALMVIISQVCRRWRGIALAHSCLWTHILACSLSEVQRHLSRSASHPLTVSGVFRSSQVAVASSSVNGDSTAIANALVESAHRWKIFHWHDGSTNGTANVLRLMKTPNAYPMLEILLLRVPECDFSGSMDTANANGAVLFPALKQLHLVGVHPIFLPHSPMPALHHLKLENLNGQLLFSQLFSLLYRSPALRTLQLDLTLPAIDFLGSAANPSPRVFPDGPLLGTRFTLPKLLHLSLNPAPATGFRYLLAFLSLPALQRLDLHLYAYAHMAHWPLITSDGRAVRIVSSHPDRPDTRVVRLPALRTLCVSYCIPTSPVPAPTPAPAPAPDTPPELPKLRSIVFPALVDLQITHLFMPSAHAAGTPPPPGPPPQPRPLRPFDTLFHAPSFTHLARLTLTACALPLPLLCDALSTRLPALEVLALCACPGAGPLACALAPGPCGSGCERPGSGDAWVGSKVREVTVRRCGDVRAGCLRKVVEARLRAGRTDSEAMVDLSPRESSAAAGPVAAADAEAPEVLATPSPAWSGERAASSDSAGEVVVPQRLVMVGIFECAQVTKEDADALAAILGGPTVRWTG